MATTEVVKIVNPKTKEKVEYAMDVRLRSNLDKTAKDVLEKKDKDCFIVVDGAEGSGKSTLALQIGKYVDPTLDISRVVFDAESFRQAIFKAKKNQCIIFDEAFNGLSSRASLSAMNRVLVGLMMQMRQKNLFIIMVLPTFFLLERYAAIFRTKALVHVYEVKGRRGYFRVYNKKLKKLLYLIGKRDYSYNDKRVRTKFYGRFYGKFALGDMDIETKYRKKKMKALESTSQDPMSAGQIKYKEQRDILLWRLRKELKMTYQEMQNYLEEYDFSINYSQIRNICVKFGDNAEEKNKNQKNQEKNDLNEDNPPKKEEK
ncbi:MAG: hypothetical protein ACLFPS_05765 [Clostridia bacterium]